MASTTKKVKVRRAIAIARRGRKRKNHDRNYGSTAADLPLNMPNANEKAMKKA
jgi:hypothetical protein